MTVFRAELQTGNTPPDDPLLPVSGPGASLVGRTALPAHQQLGQGIFGGVFALLGLGGFLHHLPLDGPAGHLLLHPVVDIPGDDGGVMVPAVVHGQFAVVLHRLFVPDRAGGVGLLPQAVTDVLLAGQDVLNHLP